MRINKIALIGAGALGVLYGNRLTEAFSNERVYFIADHERAARYQKNPFTCNAKICDFRYVEDTIKTVSYTHLDVYKRQDIQRPPLI